MPNVAITQEFLDYVQTGRLTSLSFLLDELFLPELGFLDLLEAGGSDLLFFDSNTFVVGNALVEVAFFGEGFGPVGTTLGAALEAGTATGTVENLTVFEGDIPVFSLDFLPSQIVATVDSYQVVLEGVLPNSFNDVLSLFILSQGSLSEQGQQALDGILAGLRLDGLQLFDTEFEVLDLGFTATSLSLTLAEELTLTLNGTFPTDLQGQLDLLNLLMSETGPTDADLAALAISGATLTGPAGETFATLTGPITSLADLEGPDLTFNGVTYSDFFIGFDDPAFGDEEIFAGDVATARGVMAFGLEGDDSYGGSAFADLLSGARGDDLLVGGDGDDSLDGGDGADTTIGGQGSDTHYVDNAGDRVGESRSWAGTDTVVSSVDFRMGRAHIENLELTGEARVGAGNGLANRITGNAVDNLLDGGKNNDTMLGGMGNDTYLVRAPGDTVVEEFGEGIDTVRAFRSYALEAHVERLFMQTVFTRDGNPAIFNGIGNGLDNTIVGTPFANTIIGREGRDTLKGQLGADAFVFDRALGADNVDRIIDFNTNEANEGDTLLMKGSVFGGMAAGALAAADFVAGTAALDASDRFIFDQTSGQLWFDADGSGAAAQQLVATFEQNALVTAADIEIF